MNGLKRKTIQNVYQIILTMAILQNSVYLAFSNIIQWSLFLSVSKFLFSVGLFIVPIFIKNCTICICSSSLYIYTLPPLFHNFSKVLLGLRDKSAISFEMVEIESKFMSIRFSITTTTARPMLYIVDTFQLQTIVYTFRQHLLLLFFSSSFSIATCIFCQPMFKIEIASLRRSLLCQMCKRMCRV